MTAQPHLPAHEPWLHQTTRRPHPGRSGADAVRSFTFGSYNWQGGDFGDEQEGLLSRQLVLLADARADAWVFQGCSGWRHSGGRTLFRAEQVLGPRGFLVPSSHHGAISPYSSERPPAFTSPPSGTSTDIPSGMQSPGWL